MYTLKVRALLKEHYPVHFLDSVHKLTNNIFATPCSYSNTVMRLPLKEKIQNAINKSVAANADGSRGNIHGSHYYYDCNNNGPEKDGGALIVGGRRRTRKKKNKKNGQQKKKRNSFGSENKGKYSSTSYRKGEDLLVMSF
ncbi:hypothetical protein RRG08_051890 [Elysia crispata]|uniref:Uncharacterized protein n=1 Tax=Elysia crispata TaxID=231223 RepID=A0AAE1DC50_9GAST|nr:hypothetical protein RRG08_051890 [Elysia crispata]